ncbi:MAG TPA: NAD+ synthase [Gammaproteobacteria bacterium]|nr:NAD+ synthase [Gammaproteobacteria bacterium]
MTQTLRLVMAQLNFLVGDIEGNARKIINAIIAARDVYRAQLVIFPELALCGYPPEDLLYRPELYERINRIFPEIKAQAKGIDVLLGYPEKAVGGCYNQAALMREGEIVSHYHKQQLPNYSVFDEVRYFKPGNTPCVVDIHGIPTAITICEDLWFAEPMAQAKAAGAKLAISINASPFAKDKAIARENIIAARAREGQMPVVYVNCVGAQDELVFDGGSMVFDAQGRLVQQAEFFVEKLHLVEVSYDGSEANVPMGAIPVPMSEEERIYKALVLGVREYIEKNHFPRAVLGLSGGVDSALTLAIAVDAIGKDRVEAVMMPSRYTSDMSVTDAEEQARLLGVKHYVLPIEPVFEAFLQTLQPQFVGLAPDATEENLQARCRGTLLMAISNKKKAIVLATGNKSETSVGYSTLYGDMVGGFCMLKDIPKTMVYRLVRYRNTLSQVIPERVITRAPSAELAENQLDQDFLPPYPVLDAILERYIEHDESIEDIIRAGFDADIVRRVVKMVDRNEYKRRQAAPGVRITERAFGKDWRYPITSGFSNFPSPTR